MLLTFIANTILLMYQNQTQYHYQNVTKDGKKLHIQKKFILFHLQVKCCFTSCIMCANFAYMLSTLPFDTPQLQQLDVIKLYYSHNYNINRVQISKIIINKSRYSSQDLCSSRYMTYHIRLNCVKKYCASNFKFQSAKQLSQIQYIKLKGIKEILNV